MGTYKLFADTGYMTTAKESQMPPNNRPLALRAKRVFDFVFALIALIFLLPVMLLIAIAIRLESPGPAIFKHKRVGKNGKAFTMYKFRSMYENSPAVADAEFLKMRDKLVTKVGNILRITSLDELPQLLNVLKGDMSLVGPRPFPVSEAEYNQERLALGIFDMPAGMTGWTQVNGRKHVSPGQKLEMDQWYCRNWSLGLDLKILLMTPNVVMNRDGAL